MPPELISILPAGCSSLDQIPLPRRDPFGAPSLLKPPLGQTPGLGSAWRLSFPPWDVPVVLEEADGRRSGVGGMLGAAPWSRASLRPGEGQRGALNGSLLRAAAPPAQLRAHSLDKCCGSCVLRSGAAHARSCSWHGAGVGAQGVHGSAQPGQPREVLSPLPRCSAACAQHLLASLMVPGAELCRLSLKPCPVGPGIMNIRTLPFYVSTA